MTETIPVYIKGTDKALQAEPAPDNQAIQIDTEPGTPPTTSPEERDSLALKNHFRLVKKAEEMAIKMGMIQTSDGGWVSKKNAR
jgi:hypothetical protein